MRDEGPDGDVLADGTKISFENAILVPSAKDVTIGAFIPIRHQ